MEVLLNNLYKISREQIPIIQWNLFKCIKSIISQSKVKDEDLIYIKGTFLAEPTIDHSEHQ